jgi:hypothetical protein
VSRTEGLVTDNRRNLQKPNNGDALTRVSVPAGDLIIHYSCYGKLIQSWRFIAHVRSCVQICYFYSLMISLLHLHTPEMGKRGDGQGSSGAMSPNLVGSGK